MKYVIPDDYGVIEDEGGLGWSFGKIEDTKQPCAFEGITDDPSYKGEPLLLYCSCPKCSPYC